MNAQRIATKPLPENHNIYTRANRSTTANPVTNNPASLLTCSNTLRELNPSGQLGENTKSSPQKNKNKNGKETIAAEPRVHTNTADGNPYK